MSPLHDSAIQISRILTTAASVITCWHGAQHLQIFLRPWIIYPN